MPYLEVTHWDIIAILVIGGIGYIIGFVHGRFYDLLDKMLDALSFRRRLKK